MAALAAVTIIVGNVGALGQSSLKRLLAWSSVAQAGYLLARRRRRARSSGSQATVFYLAVYLVMNVAAFAVVVARERESRRSATTSTPLDGIGRTRPWLAWPMTLAMLGLAGIPATAGFIGKFYLIEAPADGGYTWLGVVIVLGSMISLAYYLRVIAAMWMRPAPTSETAAAAPAVGSGPAGQPVLAGGSSELDVDLDDVARGRHWEVVAVAAVAGVAILATGVYPTPLFDLVSQVGDALPDLL